MGFHIKARRPSRGAEGLADRARLWCCEDALVGAGVAPYDTPATRSAVVLLCLTHIPAAAGAVIALVVRLFCFLVESIR